MEKLKVGQEIYLINVKDNPEYSLLNPIEKRTFPAVNSLYEAQCKNMFVFDRAFVCVLVDTEIETVSTMGKIAGRFTVRRLHNNDPVTII